MHYAVQQDIIKQLPLISKPPWQSYNKTLIVILCEPKNSLVQYKSRCTTKNKSLETGSSNRCLMSEGPYADYNGARGRLFLIMLPWYQCSDSLLNMLIYVISARQQKYLTILSFNLNLQINLWCNFHFQYENFFKPYLCLRYVTKFNVDSTVTRKTK